MQTEIATLQGEIQWLKQKLLQKYGLDVTDPNLKYYQLAKLQEELGELAEQVLKSDKLQRSEKGAYESEGVKSELLDVVLTALVMGSVLDIDVLLELPQKLRAARERFED